MVTKRNEVSKAVASPSDRSSSARAVKGGPLEGQGPRKPLWGVGGGLGALCFPDSAAAEAL